MAGWWRQLAGYVASGGVIMFPLLLVSLLLWTRAVERWLLYRRLQREDLSLSEAAALVVSPDADPAALPDGLRGVLVADFLAQRTGRPELDRPLLASLTRSRRRELRRGLGTVAVLAAVAPLLGLLGTVVGMVRTFDVIALFGTGHARAMAGGISLALVTTQTGLLVAIPGLLLATLLRRRARRLETMLLETTTLLQRRLAATGGGR